MPDPAPASFMKSKFDNLSLILMIVFLICLLTWVDKHGNGDYEKWLEVFTAGIGGAYLGLITGSRTPNANGPPIPPTPTIVMVPDKAAPVPSPATPAPKP